MRKVVAVLAVLMLSVVAADAWALRLYFDRDGATELGAITTDPVPSNPAVDFGTEAPPVRLYLWAEILDSVSTEWNAIGVDVGTTGGVRIVDWKYYNYSNTYTAGGVYQHWQGVGQGTNPSGRWVMNGAMVAVTVGSGVNNRSVEAKAYDTHSTYWLNQVKNVPGDTLLGYFDFAPYSYPMPADGVGEAFIYVNNVGILGPSNTLLDDIYMGFGDEDAGLKGNSFNMTGAIADATFIPEPASLLLLGLAGLALRRR